MTRLLVSVRDVEEAAIALECGADLIDVKEPDRGSLGAAEPEIIGGVIRLVSGRVPVSAALGELRDDIAERPLDGLARITFAKWGLSGMMDDPDWPARWWSAVKRLPRGASPVAVVYADRGAADSPAAEAILATAAEIGCRAALVDTFDKRNGHLFTHWSEARLEAFIGTARENGMLAVIGGSLTLALVHRALPLKPDYIAVRGAACLGGRTGTVSEKAVRELVDACRRARSRQTVGG